MVKELLQAIGRLFAWIVIVAPWEQAIRVRFGRWTRLLGPGTYLRLPFVDRVFRQTIRRRVSLVRPQVLTCKDGRSITLASALGYQIKDLMTLYNTLHDADDTIEATVQASIAAYVAGHAFEECSPGAVESHVSADVDLAPYGLSDIEFYITNFSAVKTYRIITGDIPAWVRSSGLNTERGDHEGEPRR